MLRTQSTKMHLLLLLVTMMMWDFMAMTAAQPRCDPLTQYEKHGKCCKMCGPGTRMSSSNSCLDPQCRECGINEYQDKYTSKSMCERQPYCDPNSNFEVVNTSKKKRSTCMCKEGFHCSSGECITCEPHTTCKPGHGAQEKGNHNRDTVCQNCTEGTFSNDESWDGVCKKWTECKDGHHIQQKGTDVSDNICGTRMSSSNSCLDPQCTECVYNEYQDKYTSELICKRQTYCDPNSNFEVVHTSKKKRTTCMCKEGFHCSSGECITCVPHTTCKPGHGAQEKGNHDRDTVCQNCTEGTFSNDESWDGVCKKWTECMDGHRIQQKGTDVSDNICAVGTSRTHVIAAVCGIVVIGILVAIIFFYCVCKGKQGDAEGKACFKCLEDQSEPMTLNETRVVITNPTAEEES